MRRNHISFIIPVLGIISLAVHTAFSAVQYIPYDPPNERHIKLQIDYSDVINVPNSGGKVRWKDVQIQQFPLTNSEPSRSAELPNRTPAPLLVAQTPECISDTHLDEVTSAASLKVHAQNSNVFLEGVGFTLSQKESRLEVSNQVHSILRLRPGTNGLGGPATDITSHRGEFQMKNDMPNGIALYIGDVHVADPQMKLACDWLRAELPKAESGQAKRPSHIIAETNVVIDFTGTNGEKIHATGQRGIYDYLASKTTNTETLLLTGQPRMELTNGWMTADEFFMDRITGKLRGHKNCHLHYQQAAQSTNAQAINITSDEFEYDLNSRLANFWGTVRANDGHSKIIAEYLTATLPKQEAGQTNRLDHILAETNVVIDFTDEKGGAKTHATGQKATYDYHVVGTTTNAVLELTGNPSVVLTNGWMTAQTIRMDRAQGRVWGKGGQHSVFTKEAGEPVVMDTEIFSETFEYTMSTGLAIYLENVREYGPELNLTKASLLNIQLTQGTNGQTNRIQKMVAEGDVALDFAGKSFAATDITNLPAFVMRLRMQAAGDNVAQLVAKRLSPPTIKLFNSYKGGSNATLQLALVDDLNQLTQSEALYNSNRFENVYLSQETTELMKQSPIGVDLIQLNRLLLLDAFRSELTRGMWGDKTHATGDRVIYTNTGKTGNTNGIVELRGHPFLSNYDGTMQAADAIIYDTTTRKAKFIGKATISPNLERFAKMPDSGTKGTK